MGPGRRTRCGPVPGIGEAIMIKAGIIGATGYAGQQLVSILINHPEAEIVFVSSNSYAGQKFSEVYPQFYGILDSVLLSTEEAKAAMDSVDVVFAALPNGLVFDLARKRERPSSISARTSGWMMLQFTKNGTRQCTAQRI